ncbi:MAG: alginate lyase family protein, partial [Pseudomonadota bacterium]
VDNALLLKDGFQPSAEEEPQIVFRCDSTETFDANIPYGRRPKVNLLWRLGVPGAWDRYRREVWDPPHPGPSQQIGWFKTASWVARLHSGRSDLEAGKKSMHSRGVARDVSISTYLDNLDGRRYLGVYDPEEPVFYPVHALNEATRNSPNVTKALYEAAQAALHRGPYSVANKLGTAPSGDKYDYFSQAPYWWPRPASLTGRPFVRRDGEFYPGTKLFSPGSEQFDRSSFQNLCDDATSLILAGTVFDQADFKQHAALLVRTWFVNPKTAMKPNLSYAQVRLGHDDDLGTGRGLIDFRDIVRVLDCVRLLSADGFLSEQELGLFRAWLSEFANWLETDPKALTERVQSNNHGNYYDLQLAGIARYLGDDAMLARAANWAKLRLSVQVAEDGSMPSELSRTRPAHYVAFTLAAWNHLARV